MNKSEDSRLDALEKGMEALTASMAQVLRAIGQQSAIQTMRAEDAGALTAGHSFERPTGVAVQVTAELQREILDISIGRLPFPPDQQGQAAVEQAIRRLKEHVALTHENTLRNVSETSQNATTGPGVLVEPRKDSDADH